MSTSLTSKTSAPAKKPSAKKSPSKKSPSEKPTPKNPTAEKSPDSGRRSGDRSVGTGRSGNNRTKSKAKTTDRRRSTDVRVEQENERRTVSAAALKDGGIKRSTDTGPGDSSAVRRMRSVNPFRKRVGGVAPFVPPRNRLSRQMRMREWSKRGFVQLSPGKQKLRHRILPRTVIGIAGLLMATGIGAAFSGAAFYAYYDDRLAENERTVARFVEGFDQQFTDAAGVLDEMRTESVDTIRAELGPLEDYVSDARGVISLPADVGPSVWLVETRNELGAVSYGSAFAIVGHEGGTALVTSYAAIEASTVEPGPIIELVKGNTRVEAELWSWDIERDLALLVVDREIPVLGMAGDTAQVEAVGSRVFAMSGFGGQGATASPGVLLDSSRIGLQHTAPVGALYSGGPLLNSEGKVLGMASIAYSPFDVDPGDVRQAPDVRGICVKILRCSQVKEEIPAEDAEQGTGVSSPETVRVEVAPAD